MTPNSRIMREEINNLIEKIKRKNKKATRFLMNLSESSGVEYHKIWHTINRERTMKEEEYFKIRAVIDDVEPTSKGCRIRYMSKEDIEYIKESREKGMKYEDIANSLPSGKKVSSTFVFQITRR